MNISQVRKEYVDTLCEDESQNTQGVGLALLKMSKRSVGTPEHEIIQQDSNELLLFYLTATSKR